MIALSETWAAIWLPRLASDRLIRSGKAPEGAVATYAKIGNAFELTCVNAHAGKRGLNVGMPLADARAMHPSLFVVEDDPLENARALDAVAAWCERFTPIVVVDAPDGLFLDVTGCGHLFGGEDKLLAELMTRLKAQSFTVRCAVGPTPGSAWAFARYAAFHLSLAERGLGGEGRPIAANDSNKPAEFSKQTSHAIDRPSPPTPSPQGRGGLVFESLAPLTVKALRLDPDSVALLKRLGLKTIRQLHEAPRVSLAARAGERAMLRLDQALGRTPEALTPRRPAPAVFALRRFLEPLFTVDAILEAARVLAEEVVAKLDRRGAGLRRAQLHLFGVDGRDRVIEIGLSRPEREVKAILRLFRERLNIAPEQIDAEFGIEAARLDAVQTELIDPRAQSLVTESEVVASAEKVSALVDVLSARMGAARVLRPRFRSAHAPERAAGWGAALHEDKSETSAPSPPEDSVLRRPTTLFLRAQPIESIATVPDGPPLRFRWRRVVREIVRAEGPERIASSWMLGERTRDYYRVEDAQGRRYWVYREGLYSETEQPRWYVHGLFA
ncbi:MAG: DNA polymerase Y family protein [Pseudomonadota bacterium]